MKISELIKDNPYVGRGIVVGKSESGKACVAYFIMGRSENSRNRVFALENGELFTRPYDASKMKDPSLTIYRAIREINDLLIVTNGDQTDTVYEAIKSGGCFNRALKTRSFEPDAPHYTPRISALLNLNDGNYKMSILKAEDEKGRACNRYLFDYEAVAGKGRFIHTYAGDGNPLPSFKGEPEEIDIPSSIDEFALDLWNGLNEANKISLYVRFIDTTNKTVEERLFNKNR